MASMIGNGLYQCVLGSRILGGYAVTGGMPVWKYVANRLLTLAQNILITAKLSEYLRGKGLFLARLWNACPWMSILMILYLIVRCCPKFYGLDIGSLK
jgi:hypothetical protein